MWVFIFNVQNMFHHICWYLHNNSLCMSKLGHWENIGQLQTLHHCYTITFTLITGRKPTIRLASVEQIFEILQCLLLTVEHVFCCIKWLFLGCVDYVSKIVHRVSMIHVSNAHVWSQVILSVGKNPPWSSITYVSEYMLISYLQRVLY